MPRLLHGLGVVPGGVLKLDVYSPHGTHGVSINTFVLLRLLSMLHIRPTAPPHLLGRPVAAEGGRGAERGNGTGLNKVMSRTAHLDGVILSVALPAAVRAVVRPDEVLAPDRRGREVHVALDELVSVGLGDGDAVHGRLDVAGRHLDGLLSGWRW